MYRFIVFALALLPQVLCGQAKVLREPAPSWVKPLEYATTHQDTLHAGGYYHLLLHRVYNARQREQYARTAIKVLTEKGLESASYINVNFDPSFQKLVFHSVIVKRGNKVIDKLKTNTFEMLRREENMDRLVYDKSLDAILNLDDIQVGDIVEYSYTIRGTNPVFNGKFFKTIYLNYSDPIGQIYTQIITDANHPLNFRLLNKALPAVKTEEGNQAVYTWDLRKVPALTMEDSTPSWYEAYNNVEVSEFASWQSVVEWALPLYSTKDLKAPAIAAKITEIQNLHPRMEDQIVACIQFVQDQIRYLSFSDGIQGFKPHSPLQVYNQRFGDCKDKSFLLSFMLQQLGVESYPALVNSSAGKAVGETLSNPGAFDHCITQFVYKDSVHWIDPTMTLQRGTLNNLSAPNYYNALVLSPKTTALSSMHFNPEASRIKIEEEYAFKMIGGTTTLDVKTTFTGDEANSMRNYWKSKSAEDLKTSYTNFYANEYAEIQMEGYVEFQDDEKHNVLITQEHYILEDFWTYDSLNSQSKASMFARYLSSSLSLPSSKKRTMPVLVSYPINIEQIITVRLSEPWNVTEGHTSLTSAGFVYTQDIEYIDDKFILSYSYKTLADHVSAAKAKDHFQKIEKAYEGLSHELTYGSTATKANAPLNVPFVFIGLGYGVLLFLGLRKLYLYDPRARDYRVAHYNVNGIMVLPIIGIFLSPLFLWISSADLLDVKYWKILTDPTYSGYNPPSGYLAVFMLIQNATLLGMSILLIFLIIKRRTSFPILVCIHYGLAAAFILIRLAWTFNYNLSDWPAEPATFAGIFIGGAIWIPFFIYSDRVKGTFRERLDD